MQPHNLIMMAIILKTKKILKQIIKITLLISKDLNNKIIINIFQRIFSVLYL